MPEIKSLKYSIGSGDWNVAQVSIPLKLVEQISEEDLLQWMNDVATSCPLYKEIKEEVSNHTQFLVEPEFVPQAPF